MKITFFLGLIFFAQINLLGQLLNPETDWFDAKGFFNKETCFKYRIKSIHLSLSTKKDADIIRKSANKIEYYFNPSGNIIRSKLYSFEKNQADSTCIYFSYNSQNLLEKQTEVFGPFSYTYFSKYDLDKNLTKRIKIDNTAPSPDTIMKRQFTHHHIGNTKKIMVLNDAGLPFMTQTTKWHGGKTQRIENESYLKNQYYAETEYWYLNNQLTEINCTKYNGKKTKTKKTFQYKDEKLDQILCFKEHDLVEKIAILYEDNELPKFLIVREVKEKRTHIYTIGYEYW